MNRITDKIEIRQETADDFPEVFTINRSAFGQDNEAKLVEALRNNPKVFVPELSLVAAMRNKIVGHILFSRIQIIDSMGSIHESLGLAPMAVTPEYQKKGIGGKLVRKGLERARGLGFNAVIVLGHEHYYPRFGFKPAAKWNIKAPFDVPSNVFMAIELVKGGLKNISGTVRYPNEFETV